MRVNEGAKRKVRRERAREGMRGRLFKIPLVVMLDVSITMLWWFSVTAKVGSREDSSVYIRMKIRAASEVGIKVNHIQLPSKVCGLYNYSSLESWAVT